MSSNKSFSALFTVVFLILSLVINSSCTKFFNEDPPQIGTPETKLGFETKCLANTLPVVRQFLNGNANPAEVSGIWDCFGNAMSAFQRKVRGSNRDEYSSRELTKFFEDYFLVDTQINDRLLTEMMHIKQIFVGGRNDRLTKAELQKLVAFSNQMKAISLKLLPYMKVYTLNWRFSGFGTLDLDVKYFEDANLVIQEAAKELSAMIAKNDQHYKIDNVVVFLDEMSNLYGEKWGFVEKLKTVIPLVQKLKKTLAGGEESTISPTEWRRFALLGARGYIQYLRYYYFIETAEESSGQQLIYVANSVDDLFSYLGDMVSEKPGGRFTKSEFVEVLQAFSRIFPELNFTEGFVTEAMKIKQLIFGGSVAEWTPADFVNAKSKVQAFRSLVERIWAYAQYYSLSWNPHDMDEDSGQRFFRDAEKNGIEFAQRLSSILETQYDLNDVIAFATELEKVFPSDKGGMAWVKSIKRLLPVIISYKNIVLKDNNSVIMKNQWQPFLGLTAQAYNRFLYYYYFLGARSIKEGPGLASLKVMFTDTYEVLSRLLKSRSLQVEGVDDQFVAGSIELTELTGLISSMSQADLLWDNSDPKVINDLLKVVVQKVLVSPENRLAGQIPTSLSLDSLDILFNELDIWIQNQIAVETVFKGARELTKDQIITGLSQLKSSQGLVELLKVINVPTSMVFDFEGRLLISKDEPLYDYNSVWMANIARSLVRIVDRSYAGTLDRIKKYQGINLAEANLMFNDVRGFFVSLGLIEESNVSFAENRFMEANTFTSVANGDEYMDFIEGSHLVLMILSGLSVNDMISVQIRKECAITKQNRTIHDLVSIDCFTDVYYKTFDKHFASLADFVPYKKSLPEEDFKKMVINFLKATGFANFESGKVKFSEIALVPHLIQYVEMIMKRFDYSHDGVLKRSEGMSAYPLFKDLIKKVSQSSSEKINRAAFAYLLRFGHAPRTVKEKAWFILIWANQESKWEINTNRYKLGQIFGYIADSTSTPKAKSDFQE